MNGSTILHGATTARIRHVTGRSGGRWTEIEVSGRHGATYTITLFAAAGEVKVIDEGEISKPVEVE